MTKKIEIDGVSGSSYKENKKGNDNNSWLEGDYTNRHKDSKKCKWQVKEMTREEMGRQGFGVSRQRKRREMVRERNIAFKF